MERLPFGFMNAGGWIKTPALVRKIVSVPLTSHVILGSFTVQYRPERTGGTTFDVLDDGTASNNLSLPNGGIPFLKQRGKEMVQIAHDAGKKVILNGAPFSPEDDAALATTAFEIGADIYESNRGCPNTEHTIISYDHLAMEMCDEAVKRAIGDLPWLRKVSPYVNPADIQTEIALTIKSTAWGVTATNTVPNTRLRREGKPIITADGTNGLGGMSGTGLYHLALMNAEHFCIGLRREGKTVFGVGGVSNAQKAHSFYEVGCTAIQVAAALFKSEDPHALQSIGQEWAFAHI
jgi:dihydroorotate dehydrogenase